MYQREPHARQMAFEAIPQPTTYAERLALADRTREDFDLACTIVVDALDDRSRALFGDQPNSLILVGPDGVVRMKQPWADPDELEARLPDLLPKLKADLDEAAASDDATLVQRVARARAANEPGGASALCDRLRTLGAAHALEPRLLLELDRVAAGGDGAMEIPAFARLARTCFEGRPGAEAAFLASAARHVDGAARGSLLERVLELAPEGSRARVWARTLAATDGERAVQDAR